MKFHKAFFGVHRIEVNAKDLDLFLLTCSEAKITLYHVKFSENKQYHIQILHKDWDKVKKIIEDLSITTTYVDEKGLLFVLKSFLQRKEWLIALIVSISFIVMIQQIVLDVRFGPMPVYIQKEIEKEMETIGLKKWAWIPSLAHPKQIERHMMDRVSSIQQIQVERNGNNYEIYVEEKEVAEEKEEQAPQHLVAKKAGIVETFDVIRGDIMVNRYEVVEKGDILVSGEIVNEQNEEVKHYVQAEGSVYATTWYEMNISMPLEQYKEYIAGVKAHHFTLFIRDWSMPIWGNVLHRYDEKQEEKFMKNKWDLTQKWPIQIREYYFYEKEEKRKKMTKENVRNRMTQYITKYLKKNLGKHVKINKYYILQEEYDNKKVKWNLYVSVTENIARPKSIQLKR